MSTRQHAETAIGHRWSRRPNGMDCNFHLDIKYPTLINILHENSREVVHCNARDRGAALVLLVAVAELGMHAVACIQQCELVVAARQSIHEDMFRHKKEQV